MIAIDLHSGMDAEKIYRRVTYRLIPFLIICYTFSVIDRLNIAMAKLQMLPDLGFSDAVYGLGAGLFFIGYLLFDVPSNILLHRFGARWWIGRIMVSWGIVSAAMGFVTSPTWFYLLRFLLGVAEAGFFAGLVLYITYWYPPSRRGRIFAAIVLAAPLAGLIGNPLGGWILANLDQAWGIAAWRWLFIIEGCPSILLGFLCFVLLDNGPDDATWLSPKERALLKQNLASDAATNSTSGVLTFLKLPVVWVMCLICFSISAGMYTVGFWLPTMIVQTGIAGPKEIGLYAAIPSLVSIIPLLMTGVSSDRSGERRWHVALPLFLCALGLAASTVGNDIGFVLAAMTLAASGAIVALAQFWNLPAAILSGYAAAAGIALVNSVGNLAGFFSPTIIGAVKTTTGSTNIGVLVMAAIIAIGGALCLTIQRSLVDGRGALLPDLKRQPYEL